jgi:serine/threonine protein phosphatase PrpC
MHRSWTYASAMDQGPRSHQADATGAHYYRPTGRYAWCVADGIGDDYDPADAAHRSAPLAAHVATIRGAAAGILAARADLNHFYEGAPRGQSGDCVMVTACEMSESVGGGFDVAWAGDCRAYVLQDGALVQVTEDHTEGQEMRGWEDPYWSTIASGYDHIVTRSVAGDQPIASARITGSVDMLMLCSDGVSKVLDADALTPLLRRMVFGGLRARARAIAAEARKAGSRDNIAVLLAAPIRRY